MSIKTKRIIMSLAGVSLLGVCVALLRKAELGTDPFTVLVTGLTETTGFPYYMVYIMINVILLIVVLLIRRKYVGIATILNLFLVGIIADATESLFEGWFIVNTWVGQALTLFGALAVLCFASSLYITADLGVSTYDAMALIVNDKKILPFRFARILTDLLCVGIGFLMGGVVGVGTLLTAFFMGPVIHFLNGHVTQKWLAGKKVHPQPKEGADRL